MAEVTAEQIERLVREVLAQLAPAAALPSAAAPRSTMELWLEQPVVSLRDIERRLNGVQAVVVSPRTIITPAAIDFLRERRIAIRRTTTQPIKPAATGTTLLLGVAETKFEPAMLIDYIARRGVGIEQIARTGLKTVVGELADEVAKGGRRAWLLTESTHQAVCLANRTPGVWAAPANHRGELQSAQQAIPVNFLITSPQQVNWLQLAQLAQDFANRTK
ncbi:MAG: hypothetical protein SGJ19_27660 [Planctomycetia bacterium]|nr:hypothetical protein [Planctomycetia bacterium]